MELYKTLSRFYPKKLREIFQRIFIFANAKIKTERFLGFLLFSSIFLSAIFSFLCYGPLGLYCLLFFPVFIILIHFLVYTVLVLRADARGRIIEEILPDALQLMSSNLKAGLTTDKALMLAVKPEFGPLSEELNIVGKEVMMGKDIGKALLDMSSRVKSEKLKEVALLVQAGLRSGGELVALLTQTAKNLRNQRFIEERIRSSVLMYFIFIFSAICFGSPMLFGLSSFLVEVLAESFGSMEISETTTQLPITMSQISISSGFIITFIVVCLITTSIFGSLVLGLIRKGRERDGLKYIPLLLILTLGIFFLVRLVISNVFGAAFF